MKFCEKCGKVISLVLAVLSICSIMSGCDKTSVSDYLSEAKYEEAYKIAETDGEKHMVKAENTFAYLCKQCVNDAFGGEKIDFSLQAAWCLDGKNLSEHFGGYQYYLLELKLETGADEATGYVLYNYDSENNEWNNMLNTVNLAEGDSDSDTIRLQKMIASGVKDGDESIQLESESVDRINKLITDDLLGNIELTDGMRLEQD